MNEIVKGGLYRHFKGMYYYVLDVAIRIWYAPKEIPWVR